ncbi:MAG: phosphate ABC transporter permease subunit PstC [Deltaproteobacteria bacterium]|nr:phosphate ABC transporter permease subunit PstC [Deltaproteobacteria bacterium]
MSATSPSRSEQVPLAESAPREARESAAPAWRRSPPRWHGVAEALIKTTALVAIVAIVLIFVFIAAETLPLFTSHEVRAEVTPSTMAWKQTWGEAAARWSWQPASEIPKYSIAPLIIGSLKITVVAVLVGAPLGILAAIFTSQVAPRWLREILKPTIELLAGIPSVVIGVFALLVMATWTHRLFGLEHRLNAVVAGCALSLTIIPLVFTLAEDALSSVPKSFADASLALGASKMHTVLHVMVPAALPGIAAGVVLGFGRALGETMIVVMASGNAALVSWSLGVSTRTITATIAQEMAEVVHGSPHYVVLFALGAVLLLFAFATNVLAMRIVESFRRKRGGS